MKFGRLTVVGRTTKGGRTCWVCKCDCGGEKLVFASMLKFGYVRSCGCLRVEEHASLRERNLSKAEDLTGRVYGDLTAIRRIINETGPSKWLCKCVCGNEKLVLATNLKQGNVRSCGCTRYKNFPKGKNSKAWKGGRYKRREGYVLVLNPDKGMFGDKAYIFEHVYVMSIHLGRPLLPKETVHHKNGVRDDNRIENLELWTSNHSYGQRVSDLVRHAKEVLAIYEPSALSIQAYDDKERE